MTPNPLRVMSLDSNIVVISNEFFLVEKEMCVSEFLRKKEGSGSR
jgi:hypothetical protein